MEQIPTGESSASSTLRSDTPKDDESFRSDDSDADSDGSNDDTLPEDINSIYINRPTGKQPRSHFTSCASNTARVQ